MYAFGKQEPATPQWKLQMAEWNKNLINAYQDSDVKPDKQFSIWPTIVALASPKNKTVIDIGCGSGMGTRMLARARALHVIGIDSSTEQIDIARKQSAEGVTYELQDMFNMNTPHADVITAPFVPNYATNKNDLTKLFREFSDHLNQGGKLVTVIDLTENYNNMRYGAIKTLQGPLSDGTRIKIDLYDGNRFLCTLPYDIFYFKPATINEALTNAGFIQIEWHRPIITQEGLQKYGEAFWDGYIDHPELGYVTAHKPTK